ncbi:MAG: DNA polymerase III subunit gamma/tau [Candidatus Rokubacteria bacterium]|nr:DNA polymerase III subunit gamma/tau [Candidatus Rokubacteria bacterium]
MSQYQVLARRWRPLTFEAVVGQGPIVRTLRNALARQRIAHAYLFTGPRGVGKTTTARLLAMGLSCEQAGGPGPVPCAACEPCREIVAGRALDVIEIDGASNRGIDEVRTLRENARYAPARGRRKVYIIDEVHMLTEPAFNALLKTLEEPPAHVVFVLATTEPRRLPATILSRCQRFDFRPIASVEIASGLRRILDEEAARGITVAAEPEALALIARAADGSLRDALSLLDTALAYGEGRVSAAAVRELLGSGGAEAAWGLAEAVVRRDTREALGRIERAAAEGLDLGLLCQEAMELVRRSLLVAVLETAPETSAEEAGRLRQLATGGTEDLLLLLKGLVDAEAEMRKSPHPRVDLEVAAVRLCHRPDAQAIEGLLERLERAEAELRGYGPAASAAPPRQGDLLSPPPEAPAGRKTVPPAAPARPPVVRPAPLRDAPRPAPPAAPTATAPAGPDAAWARIVEEVTRARPTLGHLLADAVVLSDEGGRLTVSLPNGNAFAHDLVRQQANRQLVLEAARRVRPDLRDVQFTTGAGPAPPAEEEAPVTGHPAVQAAVELFDGEVTDVRPAARGGRREPSDHGNASPDSGEVT